MIFKRTPWERPNSDEGNLSRFDANHRGCGAYLSLICLLVYSMLVVGSVDVRAALAASRQAPIEVLHVPEIEAGFHLLYELKPEKARTQFEVWQMSHPEDPLGSASEAAGYLFEECYRQASSPPSFSWTTSAFYAKSL
jgi:hypothetical protein